MMKLDKIGGFRDKKTAIPGNEWEQIIRTGPVSGAPHPLLFQSFLALFFLKTLFFHYFLGVVFANAKIYDQLKVDPPEAENQNKIKPRRPRRTLKEKLN
jgi:hypothetical protein